MKIRQTKWVIGIALLAVGVGIVLATSLPKSMQYYVTVDELLGAKTKYAGKPIKVAGKVAAGSIEKVDKNLRMRFRVENGDQQVWVNYRGPVPDTFKEGADVVVTGTFAPNEEVVATELLAKCSSKYEEKLEPGLGQPASKGR
ncbi:MAG: cytochrome c maturation protein CcmE [Pseudomonadota bacterium]